MNNEKTNYTKSVNHYVMHLINVTNYLIRSRPDKGSPFQSGVSVSVLLALGASWRGQDSLGEKILILRASAGGYKSVSRSTNHLW